MANLIKTAVLDKRTEENTSGEYGDFVFCTNCGKTMVVNIGTEKCPECGEVALMWENSKEQEVSDEFFDNNKDYILINSMHR